MVARDSHPSAAVGKREYQVFPFEDVEKMEEIREFSTHLSTHRIGFQASHIPRAPQGPLPISARTPSTVWRNSASTLIASSTLRIEWITVE